jgi:hypothetical protein
VHITSVRDAVYKCWEFPEDIEYPNELPGLTPVPRLLQGFAPRQYFEKHLNFCNAKNDKKIAGKVKENISVEENNDEGKSYEKVKMCKRQMIEEGKFYYVCCKCHYKKVTKAAVEGHFLEKHTDAKPFSCRKCQYVTYNSDRFRQHTKIDGCSKNRYYCSKCNFVTSTKANISHHEKTHKAPKLKCFKCGKMFRHSWVLKNHVKNHDKK